MRVAKGRIRSILLAARSRDQVGGISGRPSDKGQRLHICSRAHQHGERSNWTHSLSLSFFLRQRETGTSRIRYIKARQRRPQSPEEGSSGLYIQGGSVTIFKIKFK